MRVCVGCVRVCVCVSARVRVRVRVRSVLQHLMSWISLGGDITSDDYLMDSDRMARQVPHGRARNKRRAHLSHACSVSHCSTHRGRAPVVEWAGGGGRGV
jgi:hypothetical protein